MLSALKNFGVTFLVSILIFGIIAYFATSFVTGTVESILQSEKEQLNLIINDPEKSDIEAGNIGIPDQADEINGNSFSFLLITTDYVSDSNDNYVMNSEDTAWCSSVDPTDTIGMLKNHKTAHVSSITLVIADKEDSEFVYSYITPSVRVSTLSGYRTLSEVYYTYGPDKLKEYVSSLTGINADYTFLISGGDFNSFTSIAGTVTAENPCDVYYDGKSYTYSATSSVDGFDENGERITVTHNNDFILYTGTLEMTSDRLYTALSVIEHSKNDLVAKQTVVFDVAEGYIKSFASLSKALLGETLTNLTITKNAVSTDFTVRDLDSVYELFSYADDFETVELTFPCTFRSSTDTSEEYFKPETDKAVELFAKYRNLNKSSGK